MKARRALARKEVLLLEGATPGTSDHSVENSVGSIKDSESEDHVEDPRPKTPPPKSPGLPQPPQTPRSVPLPQTPGTAPNVYTDDDEKKRIEDEKMRIKKQIAKSWDENFQAWLKRVPEDEEDERWYHYLFLGEAYVHGMMDGEAMEYQNMQEIKTSLFELR